MHTCRYTHTYTQAYTHMHIYTYVCIHRDAMHTHTERIIHTLRYFFMCGCGCVANVGIWMGKRKKMRQNTERRWIKLRLGVSCAHRSCFLLFYISKKGGQRRGEICWIESIKANIVSHWWNSGSHLQHTKPLLKFTSGFKGPRHHLCVLSRVLLCTTGCQAPFQHLWKWRQPYRERGPKAGTTQSSPASGAKTSDCKPGFLPRSPAAYLGSTPSIPSPLTTALAQSLFPH